MSHNYFKIRCWLLVFFASLAFIPVGFGQGRGVWKGDKITFTKSNYATYTNSSAQDRITDSVWITRKNDQGVFNIKTESGYSHNVSPKGTKWAFGTTANYKTLVFRDWETAVGNNPPGMVNKDMVMLILKDSIMIDVKFTSWTSGGSGGGFTYIRTTDCRSFNTISRAQCDSFVSPSGKYTWRKSGTYYDTLVNHNTCDSIITIKLTVYGQDTGKIFMSGCGFATMPLSKRKVYATGTYVDTLKNGTICGRDSILIANVFIYPLPTKTMNISACDSFKSPSGKYVWKTSGTYQDVLKATGTCDTTATINLTINNSKKTQITESACNSFVSPTKKVYTASGRYYDTLMTTKGCDSIVDMMLTIHNSVTHKISPVSCSLKYTSPSGKYVWTTSGIYYDTLMTKYGCDSVLEINVKIQPLKNTVSAASCGPWTSPSGKYVYTATGTYLDTLQTVQSCDSILTINFTKKVATTSTVDVTAAINRYYSPSGKYMWATSGTYMDTIANKAGCDSIITFNITVAPISLNVSRNGTKLTAEADGVNYQWLDCDKEYAKITSAINKTYTVAKNGKYAVELSNKWNKDTTDCISVNLGIEDFEHSGISIYPNPNDGQFIIDLIGFTEKVNNIVVLNAQGQVVRTINDPSQITIIDELKNSASGIYFIRITGNNFSYNTSVIVR
ncbi:MAG: T9SS type A sorting domain-containing protein [Bacteroidetes bacterium]|nr:T9SS type A sorting domain-containing protein [Bacteroidota bacterium]